MKLSMSNSKIKTSDFASSIDEAMASNVAGPKMEVMIQGCRNLRIYHKFGKNIMQETQNSLKNWQPLVKDYGDFTNLDQYFNKNNNQCFTKKITHYNLVEASGKI